MDEATYLGTKFNRQREHIFADVYGKKSSKAKKVAWSVFGLQDHIGAVPPHDARKMYMATVDLHLIYAAEVMLDVSKSLLQKHRTRQYTFLWRLLGVDKGTPTAVLFTETGLLPIAHCRLEIALSYLSYPIPSGGTVVRRTRTPG